MAAEYSRELSVKVHAGACRYTSMGFQLGGLVPYGLQRMLVDEKLQPKGILKRAIASTSRTITSGYSQAH